MADFLFGTGHILEHIAHQKVSAKNKQKVPHNDGSMSKGHRNKMKELSRLEQYE